jgi:hypothetical protein
LPWTMSRPSTFGPSMVDDHHDGPVLGFGDSISVGPEEGAFGVPPRAWAQWLAEALDVPFHRVAQPGALTPWMAEALLPRVQAGYALACIGVGTNDVRSVDWDARSFAVALGRILDGAGERAARTCVATLPLDLGRPRAGPKVAEANAIIRTEAAARGSVIVALDDFGGWRRRFPDAVHPTALGQLEIARRAAEALALDVSPVDLTSVQTGIRPTAHYALTRQVSHLARDWRRKAAERNV